MGRREKAVYISYPQEKIFAKVRETGMDTVGLGERLHERRDDLISEMDMETGGSRSSETESDLT